LIGKKVSQTLATGSCLPSIGKGFITMAVRAVVDYAFEQYKLKTVSIRCPIHNSKSRAIPERLGFNLAEIKLGYTSRAPTGQTIDYASYLISRHQWYESPNSPLFGAPDQ
jgi:RimJ/RimL family protein N-acetyltransferase